MLALCDVAIITPSEALADLIKHRGADFGGALLGKVGVAKAVPQQEAAAKAAAPALDTSVLQQLAAAIGQLAPQGRGAAAGGGGGARSGGGGRGGHSGGGGEDSSDPLPLLAAKPGGKLIPVLLTNSHRLAFPGREVRDNKAFPKPCRYCGKKPCASLNKHVGHAEYFSLLDREGATVSQQHAHVAAQLAKA